MHSHSSSASNEKQSGPPTGAQINRVLFHIFNTSPKSSIKTCGKILNKEESKQVILFDRNSFHKEISFNICVHHFPLCASSYSSYPTPTLHPIEMKLFACLHHVIMSSSTHTIFSLASMQNRSKLPFKIPEALTMETRLTKNIWTFCYLCFPWTQLCKSSFNTQWSNFLYFCIIEKSFWKETCIFLVLNYRQFLIYFFQHSPLCDIWKLVRTEHSFYFRCIPKLLLLLGS